MVRITGSLRFVTDNPAQVSEVWLRAPKVRTHLEGVVTTGNDRFPANNGEVAFTAVPGPAVLALISQGRAVDTIPILVGDAPASQTLAEVVKRARVAGGRTAEELQVLVRQIQEAVSGSGEQATAAATSAKAAAGSASEAKSSESSARSSASQAKTSASQASSSASAAESSERSAGTSAKDAAASERNAGASASNAEKSAQAAREDAERAATIAGSTRWVGTKVEVNGKLSPDLKGQKGDKGDPGQDGTVTFDKLTDTQRESLVGKQGPAGVVASSTDPGKDVVWLDTNGRVGGLSEPIAMTASGSGWQYATKPGGSSRYVVDYRGWAVLTVTATNCDEVRLYDFSQATNPFAVGAAPAGNIKGAFLTTQAVVNCAPNGPAVRVFNPTPETKIWLSVEPLEARGQVVWVPDGKGGRESFTALSGPPGPPGPPGTTAWSGITGKPALFPSAWGDVVGKPDTYPPATHTHTVSDLSDISVGVRNTLKNGNTSTTASSTGAVAWGRGASATNTDAVALGYNTQASGTDSAALGSYSKATQTRHVVVGVGATDEGVAQQHGTVIIGKTGAPVIISGRNVVSELDSLGEQVATRATKNEVTRRPALFSGPGPCPPDIADRGAVVGDHWLNTNTMELERITGV